MASPAICHLMCLQVAVEICEWSHHLGHRLPGFRFLPEWPFAASTTQVSLYGLHASTDEAQTGEKHPKGGCSISQRCPGAAGRLEKGQVAAPRSLISVPQPSGAENQGTQPSCPRPL